MVRSTLRTRRPGGVPAYRSFADRRRRGLWVKFGRARSSLVPTESTSWNVIVIATGGVDDRRRRIDYGRRCDIDGVRGGGDTDGSAHRESCHGTGGNAATVTAGAPTPAWAPPAVDGRRATVWSGDRPSPPSGVRRGRCDDCPDRQERGQNDSATYHVSLFFQCEPCRTSLIRSRPGFATPRRQSFYALPCNTEHACRKRRVPWDLTRCPEGTRAIVPASPYVRATPWPRLRHHRAPQSGHSDLDLLDDKLPPEEGDRRRDAVSIAEAIQPRRFTAKPRW